MKTTEIKKLLESFYDGTTSQSEELLLINYFNSPHVAEELLEEKEIFLQFYQADDVAVPAGLASKLNMLINDLDKENDQEYKKNNKKFIFWGTSIAASIAILISAGIYMDNLSLKGDHEELAKIAEERKDQNSLLITDAEYQEAEKAMHLLSTNFNKGIEQLDSLSDNLEKTQKIIEETFNQNK